MSAPLSSVDAVAELEPESTQWFPGFPVAFYFQLFTGIHLPGSTLISPHFRVLALPFALPFL